MLHAFYFFLGPIDHGYDQTYSIFTSFKDYAVIGYFISGLQAGAVPAVPSKLVLTLMDGNLDSLDR